MANNPESAATIPAIVGIVAFETPPAIALTSPPPVKAITSKTVIIPVTVPSNPNSGATAIRVLIIIMLLSICSAASEITFSRICRANFDLRSFLPDHTSILILRTLGQDFVRYQTLSKIRVHIKKSNITIIQSTLPPESMNLPISASVSTKNIDYLLSKEPATIPADCSSKT